MSDYARWKDVFHYGFGYTVCPYCGDETPWYNPVSTRFQSDLKNNQREYCPKCGKRVYAREGWIMNQPPEAEKTMSDYIRREDAIKAVHEEFDDCVVWDESGERTADEVESIIDRVLSADVAPVRHARWRHYEGMYACEDCGAQLDDESPFCPMCGAKMDGGENG